MSDSVGLLFKIKADAKQAVNEVQQFRHSLGGELKGVEGTSATTFASVKTSALLAVGAITAIVGAVSTAGTAILALSKQFADAGSEIHDTAQKMGVAAETASVLKFAAEQSGQAFDGLAQPIARFSALVGEAARGSESAAEKLKRFGIDPQDAIRDLDGALEKVFQKIHAAPEGVARLTLAGDAFGKRAGANVIPIIETMNGSLSEFTKIAIKAGQVMSKEDVNAADALGDAMDQMTASIKLATFSFAAELAPTLTEVFGNASKLANDSKSTFREWGQTVGEVIRGVRVVAESEVGQAVITIANLYSHLDPIIGILRALKALGASQPAFHSFSGSVPSPFPGSGILTEKGRREQEFNARAEKAKKSPDFGDIFSPTAGNGKGRATKDQQDEIYQAALDASRDAADAETETQRHLSESLKQAYELNIVNLKQYYKQRQDLIDKSFNDEIDAINREQAALEDARARGLIKAEEAAKKDRELIRRTEEAKNREKEESRQNTIDRQRALDKADLDRERGDADIRLARREGELQTIQDLLDHQVITEADAIDQRLRLEKDAHDDRMDLIDLELRQLTTSAERKVELDKLKEASEIRYTNTVTELTQRRLDAVRQQAEQYVKLDTEAADLLRVRELQERRQNLERLAALHGLNRQIIAALRELRGDEEREHHNRIMDEIAAQEAQARAVDVGGKHRLEIEQRYNALRQQENKRFQEQRKQDDEDSARPARAGAGSGFLSGLESGQISELKDGVQSFSDVATVAFSAIGAAVNGLAQGIGNLVQNWVLMGNQAGVSVRKMVAAVLAGVAQQAATLAIMSLAYAALATTGVGAILLGGTPAQFLIAAALFGAVAAGAALIGRAVAGNEFQSKGATSGGAQKAGSTAPTSTEPKPIEIDRRNAGGSSIAAGVAQAVKEGIAAAMEGIQGGVPEVHVHMSGQATEGFQYLVEKVMVKSYRSQGKVRDILMHAQGYPGFYG
jgi:hypothetical protein